MFVARPKFFHSAIVFFIATMFSASLFAVSINEIRIDQPGSDNDEYVELFTTVDGESLSGVSFIILQDNGNIDGVVDLSAQSFATGDPYFVLAESTFTLGTADLTTNLNLENGENSTYLLVSGFTGAEGDDLDPMDDGTLTTPWTSIIDGVSILDDEDTVLDGGPEDIDYSNLLGVESIGPDGSFAPVHFFADPDGGMINSIGAFNPADAAALDSPGSTNTVPEPNSMLMAVLGLLCLNGLRRRR